MGGGSRRRAGDHAGGQHWWGGGSSTPAERQHAPMHLLDLDANPLLPQPPAGAEDGEAIEMAFSKKKVEERKDWLRSYVTGTFLDHSADTISYNEFVHKVGWA